MQRNRYKRTDQLGVCILIFIRTEALGIETRHKGRNAGGFPFSQLTHERLACDSATAMNEIGVLLVEHFENN